MKGDVSREVTAIYDKIQKETAQSLKKYIDGLKAIEEQTKRSWAFTGLKEALFWGMCLAVILFEVGGGVLSAYGITLPASVWAIAGIITIIPSVVYAVVKNEKNNKNKR